MEAKSFKNLWFLKDVFLELLFSYFVWLQRESYDVEVHLGTPGVGQLLHVFVSFSVLRPREPKRGPGREPGYPKGSPPKVPRAPTNGPGGHGGGEAAGKWIRRVAYKILFTSLLI